MLFIKQSLVPAVLNQASYGDPLRISHFLFLIDSTTLTSVTSLKEEVRGEILHSTETVAI